METYILKKSDRKNKRFVIIMDKMNHDFGSSVGKTFVDNRTEKEKQAWISRHKNDKNWNNKHSGIYYSRYLLWNTPDLKKNIKLLEKKDNVKIKVEL
tara:strand:+ start:217 stop:507 length:291 start_codon:yes stop_codon:yes gene_type:complete